MLRLVAVVGTVLLLGIVAFISQGSFSPATAGIPIPPPGTDELNVNGEVDIDITLCCGTSETVQLAGFMDVQRGPISKEGVIDIEIVSMSLTGTSSLLGTDTPVTVSLNPNAGEPAVGQIIPAKGIAQFSIPFMDVQIGPFDHFLQEPVDMFAEITGIPPFGDKFTSQATGNPIQDNAVSGPDGVRGTLDRFNIDIKPPDKGYTITVLKQHSDTKAGLPGWEMNIFAGPNCQGNAFDSAETDGEGIAEFIDLAAGTYSVREKPQDAWNNITPLCQNTAVPAVAGVAGMQACPIQPDLPPPAAGCDEFNSAASVNVEFFNPPGAQIHCSLGGPTQITRSAVIPGTLDNIQTEITVLDLSGTCDPGGISVTVRQSSEALSTGKITEQQNNEAGELEFKANSFFDVFFEVDVGDTILHNQEPLHLECKIQDIPPYGCLYEPDVGSVTLFNADKKEVAKLIHAAHIPLDPKQKLLIFVNQPKPPTTPTPTASTDETPTPSQIPGDETSTPTLAADATPTPSASPTKTPQEQRTRHVTLRCVRSSPDQKVIGSATVTEKKAGQPSRVVLDVSCNSNTEPVVQASYSISASATKNVQLNVSVDGRTNDCSFPGFAATDRVSESCTASPEGLELVDTQAPGSDGDANKNDTVDSIDAALILQFIAGLTGEWPNSDTNGDGTTNAIDVALILQFTAGFLNGLPA